jgi:hypothetical protein
MQLDFFALALFKPDSCPMILKSENAYRRLEKLKISLALACADHSEGTISSDNLEEK